MTTSTPEQTVDLTTSSPGGAFYASQTSTTPITSLDLAAGQSTASFYYTDTRAGSPTVTADDGTLGSAPPQQETVSALSASEVAITSTPLVLTAGARGQLTIELEDLYGNPAISGITQTIDLGTTSPAGSFYATSTGGSPITSVTIPIGGQSVTVDYTDTPPVHPP